MRVLKSNKIPKMEKMKKSLELQGHQSLMIAGQKVNLRSILTDAMIAICIFSIAGILRMSTSYNSIISEMLLMQYFLMQLSWVTMKRCLSWMNLRYTLEELDSKAREILLIGSFCLENLIQVNFQNNIKYSISLFV